MNIQTSPKFPPQRLFPDARRALPKPPCDSVTLSDLNSVISSPYVSIPVAFLPGAGALPNLGLCTVGHIFRQKQARTIGALGVVSNITGTVAGGVYLATGSELARSVAIGGLIGSGATAAFGFLGLER